MTQAQVPATATIRLKVTLMDSEPVVWRQILVPADITLTDLHEIIQKAMGWQHLHDYSFHLGWGTQKTLLDAERSLFDLLSSTEQQPIYYNYDSQDGWRHRLDAEQVEKSDAKMPVCTAGNAACPPEGSGGVWGYDRLLAQLENEEDPEYIDLLDRYGEIDPDAFELSEANARLGGELAE